MTTLTCKVYGDVRKMSDRGLQHAYNTNIIRMGWSPDNAAFKGLYSYEEYKEAMAMLIAETERRTSN